MKKPIVSIIVPAFNEEEHLLPTIAAIRKSIIFSKMPAELIVVDNNSEDSTLSVAKKLVDRVYSEKIRVIAAVRNTGAKYAKGKYLIFVDADTLVPRELVVDFVSAMEHGAVVVGCKVMPHPVNIFEKIVFKFFNLILRSSVLHGATFSGNAVGYTKKAFEKLKGFDEQRVASEDHDLSNRASRIGNAIFLNNVTVLTSNRRIANLGLLWVVMGWGKTTLFYLFGVRRKKYRITR
ncbi:MAG: glycosyltransferase [Candidatus Micrarchaeota archaeon]|nr:glycosyltransferase [Candidatus Micrarchaeota archaeon]